MHSHDPPDVMVTMPPTAPAAGSTTWLSSTLRLEAFPAAADPAKFPEQLRQGLRPWQVKKLYQPGGVGFGASVDLQAVRAVRADLAADAVLVAVRLRP